MRKLATSVTVLLALVLAVLPVSSANAMVTVTAGSPWEASYQTATASGTAEVATTGFFTKELAVTGELANTGPDCYYAALYISRDFGGSWRPSPVQCGPGASPIDFRIQISGPIWSAWMYVCQGSTPGGGPFPPFDSCGAGVRVP